jgi:hypothetical protein
MGGTGGAQRPVLRVNEPKKTGARNTRARTRGQDPLVYNKGVGKKAVVRFWSGTLAIEVSLTFLKFCRCFLFNRFPFPPSTAEFKGDFCIIYNAPILLAHRWPMPLHHCTVLAHRKEKNPRKITLTLFLHPPVFHSIQCSDFLPRKLNPEPSTIVFKSGNDWLPLNIAPYRIAIWKIQVCFLSAFYFLTPILSMFHEVFYCTFFYPEQKNIVPLTR